MNRAPALLLWTTMALRVGTLLVCLAIFVALVWGFLDHKAALPRFLIVAFWIIVPARILIWLAWRTVRARGSA